MANALTALRLALIPLIVYLIASGSGLAAVIFVLAAATDFIDGFVARLTDQVTDIGRLLDPLTDRLFVVLVVLAVYLRDMRPPLWALGLLAARDTAVVVGSSYLRAVQERVDVSYLGKTATAVLVTAIFFLIMRLEIGLWLFYAGLIASLASGFGYFVQGKKVLGLRAKKAYPSRG